MDRLNIENKDLQTLFHRKTIKTNTPLNNHAYNTRGNYKWIALPRAWTIQKILFLWCYYSRNDEKEFLKF